MTSEPDLVLQAMRGDPTAFGSLVERHWAGTVRLARSVVGESEAEDVAQEGLLRAWQKLSGLKEPAAFRRWLFRVVFRVCLRHARRGSGFLPLEAIPEPGARTNPNPGIDVGRLMASLPPRQRAVMHLTIVEGLTDSEIGSILGITSGAVRAHRHRARERLKRELTAGDP